MRAMTETEAGMRPGEAAEIPSAESALDPTKQAKAQQVVAYLSYALEDMRALSPTQSPMVCRSFCLPTIL